MNAMLGVGRQKCTRKCVICCSTLNKRIGGWRKTVYKFLNNKLHCSFIILVRDSLPGLFIHLAIQMNRSDIFLQHSIFQENSSQAKSQMQARLYAQTLCKMCGISGIVRLTAILRVVVADIVFAEEGDVLADALFFHTFGKKAFLYAISKTTMPTLFCVGLLLSSFVLI